MTSSSSNSGDQHMQRIRHIQELVASGVRDPASALLHAQAESETTRGGAPEPAGDHDSRPPRSRSSAIRRGAIGAGALAIAITVTLAVIGIGPGHDRDTAASSPVAGFAPDPADGASSAQQTGQAFLAAWQRGDLHAAADITDDPSAAYSALQSYQHDLHVSGLTFQPNGAGAAGWLTFGVAAQVGSPTSTWSYSSGLATYQGTADGSPRWFVKWTPGILFTDLKPGEHLALGSIPPTASGVADSEGRPITAANAPSLVSLASGIERDAAGAGAAAGARAGTDVEVESGHDTVLSTAATVARPVDAGPVRTTIDLSAQAAAQAAADRAPNSSVVVVQPSTGAILAIANNPPNGVDTAMIGALAPGSTFKVVSSTMLFDQGLVTSVSQPVPCPKVLQADGLFLHNSEQEQAPGNDFLQDFAQSCNNAFSGFYRQVGAAQIAATARRYFGFDEPWDIGLHQPTTYANVPTGPDDSVAEEMVGQDRITASPLAMASVAATVATGDFKQPIVIPDASQTTATPLPARDLSDLRTLMHSVVTQGTLAGVITDASGTYGKTGTAEIGTSDNSWTIAYRGDYAVCALAVDGGFGAAVAGPEVDGVLRALAP